jgi:hypothetical protein
LGAVRPAPVPREYRVSCVLMHILNRVRMKVLNPVGQPGELLLQLPGVGLLPVHLSSLSALLRDDVLRGVECGTGGGIEQQQEKT